jgi:hypothetical protein
MMVTELGNLNVMGVIESPRWHLTTEGRVGTVTIMDGRIKAAIKIA